VITNKTNLYAGLNSAGEYAYIGALKVGNYYTKLKLNPDGGQVQISELQLMTLAAPTCDATKRGQFNYVAGAAGVKDIVQVCAKDAANAYAWRTIY
jgi:hypothetical protein